jgi:hypothetical protein
VDDVERTLRLNLYIAMAYVCRKIVSDR